MHLHSHQESVSCLSRRDSSTLLDSGVFPLLRVDAVDSIQRSAIMHTAKVREPILESIL